MLELAHARWRTSRIAKQLGIDPTLVKFHVGHLVDDRPLGYGRPPVQPRQMEAA